MRIFRFLLRNLGFNGLRLRLINLFIDNGWIFIGIFLRCDIICWLVNRGCLIKFFLLGSGGIFIGLGLCYAG